MSDVETRTEWAVFFKNILAAATAERHRRQSIVRDELGDRVPEWVEHERLVMLAAINEARSMVGQPLVDYRTVARLDERATGADWLQKFALFCAEESP